MYPVTHYKRRGFSLLELVVMVAVMGAVLTSSFVLLRTSRTAWEAFDDDQAKLEMTHAALRHMVRKLRQADLVTALSLASDNSGSISARLTDGTICTWDHTGTQINFNTGGANALLANNVAEMTVVGYKADGTTATTTAAEVQSVKITLKVTLTRSTSATKTITCWAWRRAW